MEPTLCFESLGNSHSFSYSVIYKMPTCILFFLFLRLHLLDGMPFFFLEDQNLKVQGFLYNLYFLFNLAVLEVVFDVGLPSCL